jgi:hypothetical protein
LEEDEGRVKSDSRSKSEVGEGVEVEALREMSESSSSKIKRLVPQKGEGGGEMSDGRRSDDGRAASKKEANVQLCLPLLFQALEEMIPRRASLERHPKPELGRTQLPNVLRADAVDHPDLPTRLDESGGNVGDESGLACAWLAGDVDHPGRGLVGVFDKGEDGLAFGRAADEGRAGRRGSGG